MKNTGEKSAAGEYAAVGTQTGVTEATPHRLIQMLLDGALDKIARAKGAMQRKEIAEKGSYISSASSIVLGLHNSLDMEAGGEMAVNLANLYGYMTRRLMEGHVANDIAALDEVASLLRELKCGWDAMPDEAINGGEMVKSMVGA